MRLTTVDWHDICQNMARCLVVKLMGRSIHYETLAQRLPKLWSLEGIFELVELGMGFFLIRLQKREGYDFILHGGPWVRFQHYLTVCRWTLNFKASHASITSNMVWVRLPEIPYPFFSQTNRLREIGNMISNFVKVDDHTENASKGRFARVAVEVDLKKPFLPKYLIENS